jgi:hypothetical protein
MFGGANATLVSHVYGYLYCDFEIHLSEMGPETMYSSPSFTSNRTVARDKQRALIEEEEKKQKSSAVEVELGSVGVSRESAPSISTSATSATATTPAPVQSGWFNRGSYETPPLVRR